MYILLLLAGSRIIFIFDVWRREGSEHRDSGLVKEPEDRSRDKDLSQETQNKESDRRELSGDPVKEIESEVGTEGSQRDEDDEDNEVKSRRKSPGLLIGRDPSDGPSDRH
jgi:hypothetical protein